MARLIPGIPYANMPRTHGGALVWPPVLIVVHATDNPTANARGEASYASTGGSTSAHAYVDTTTVLGSLPLDYQAAAAFGWANRNAIHIELCGVSGRVPEATQRAGAALVRQLCLMAGIRMTHLDGAAVRALHDGRGVTGVCGHADITAADFDQNDHTDPGFSASDWARFMGWVTADQQKGNDVGTLDGVQAEQLANLEKLRQALQSNDPVVRGVFVWTGQGKTGGEYRDVPLGIVQAVQAVKAQLDQLAARPAAQVALTADDRTAIAAAVASQLAPVVRAAAEDAVRKVLGGLDGAVPPAAP